MERKYLKENNGFVGRNSITVALEQSSPYYYYSKSQKNGITASANNSTDGLILLESTRGSTNCFAGQEQKQQQQHNGYPECVIKDKTIKRTYASNLYEKSGERHSESYQNNFGIIETTLYPSWIGNTAARENQKISQIQKIYNNSIIHRSRLNQNAYPNNNNGITSTAHNQSKNKSPVQFFNNQSNNISNTASQQEKIMEISNATETAENQKFLRTQLSQILPQSPHKNCNQPLRKYYSSQHMSQGVGYQQGGTAGHFPKDDCSPWNNQNYKSNCSSSSALSHDQSNESGLIYFKSKENNNDFQKNFLSKQIRKNEMNHGNQETTPSKQILESTFEQFKILPQAQISPLVLPPPPQKRLAGGVLDSSRRPKDKHKNSTGFLGISPNSKFYSTEPHFNKQILKRLQGGDSKLSGKPQLSPISQSKIIPSDSSKKDQLTGQQHKKLIPTDIEDNSNNKSTKYSQKQESKDCMPFCRQAKSQKKQEEHEGSHITQEGEEESPQSEQQMDQKQIHSTHLSSQDQRNQQSACQKQLCWESEMDANHSSLQNKSKGDTQIELLALVSNRQLNQLEKTEQETKEIPAELWEQVRAISEVRPKTSGGGKRRLRMNKQMEQNQVRSNQDIEGTEEFREECQKPKQKKQKKMEEIACGEESRELDQETSKQSEHNQKEHARQMEVTEEEYANCSDDFEEDLKEDSNLGKMGRKQKQDNTSFKFNKTHQGKFLGQNKRESENLQIELSRLSSEQGKKEKLFNLHKKNTKVTNNMERENTEDEQISPHKIIIRHTKTAASTARVQKQHKSQQDDVVAREIVKFETGLDSEFIQLFAAQKLL